MLLGKDHFILWINTLIIAGSRLNKIMERDHSNIAANKLSALINLKK